MTETKLLQCPFCGGEAMTIKAEDIGCVIKCRRCGILNAGYYPSDTHRTKDEFSGFTEEEYAIEAWNTRYERTCSVENTTCTCNDDVWTTAKCSECEADYTIDFAYLNYCPNCGAKVVD